MSLQFLRAERVAYGFTVKDNRTDTTDYIPFFDKLNKFNIEVECKYGELDSKGKLHYHGIMYIPKGFYRKKLLTEGLHLHLEELYNRQGWVTYIRKCHKSVNLFKEIQSLVKVVKKNIPEHIDPDDVSDTPIDEGNLYMSEPETPEEERCELPKKKLF